MDARIRAARAVLGWSQQELADRAGVTRQLVGAVEAGRQTPSVTAAVALARALGTTVEELFAPDAGVAAAAVPAVAPAGPELAAAGSEALSPERWAVADAAAWPAGIEVLPGGRTDGLVIAGCDPALGLVADLVERSSRHRVVAVHASTGRAVDALAGGTVHGVLVHGAVGELPDPPVPVRRWRVATWAVGLAAVADGSRGDVADLAERGCRVAQREPGAGSQRALRRALERAGIAVDLPGPVGGGHLDVARRVRWGDAEAGVTIEAAARATGLGFRELEVHEAELWVDERWADLAEVATVGDVLCGQPFLRRARLLAGYDVARCGTRRSA